MIDFCSHYSLERVQLSPTRVTKNTANVLDLMITSNAKLKNETNVIPDLSDDDTVLVDSSLKPEIQIITIKFT